MILSNVLDTKFHNLTITVDYVEDVLAILLIVILVILILHQYFYADFYLFAFFLHAISSMLYFFTNQN